MSFAAPSKQNKNTKLSQQHKRFSNTRQILAIGGFAALFLTSGSVTIYLISSFLYIRNDASYPTALPWVESRTQCEEFGRTWRNDRCWDEEHSHNF